jgi:RNA 2',3'-cyclic 3'-phosphodiesterase
MKRIFIALKIEPGEKLSGMISMLKTSLSKDLIKWTVPGNIHITLAFLGDTDENQIEPVISMLGEKCSGSGSFDLILRGAGVFRNLKDPRIIWTGVEPSDKLNHLNKSIVNGLKDLNINLEDRAYNPHLTLGRIKHLNDSNRLRIVLEQFQNAEIQRIPVNEVILYESILMQTGPVYTPLAEFGLEQ